MKVKGDLKNSINKLPSRRDILKLGIKGAVAIPVLAGCSNILGEDDDGIDYNRLEKVMDKSGKKLSMPIDGAVNDEQIIKDFLNYCKFDEYGPVNYCQIDDYDPVHGDLLNEVFFKTYDQQIPDNIRIAYASPETFKEITGYNNAVGMCIDRQYILIKKGDFLSAVSTFSTLAHETGHATQKEPKKEYISAIVSLRLCLGVYTNFQEIGSFEGEYADSLWTIDTNPYIHNLYNLLKSFQGLTRDDSDAYKLASTGVFARLEQGQDLDGIERSFRDTPIPDLDRGALEVIKLSHEQKGRFAYRALDNLLESEVLPGSGISDHGKELIRENHLLHLRSLFLNVDF